jgi:hypothetical protein
MNAIEEKEKNYRQDGQYFPDEANQNDIGAPLDNSVTNDEEQDIDQSLKRQNDFYNESDIDVEKDLNNNDPYPDDDEDETDDEDLDDEDQIEDEDLENDLDDEDDFQEDDLDDADDDIDATNPINPSQF